MLPVVSSVFPEKWSQKRQKCRFDKHQLKIVHKLFWRLELVDRGTRYRGASSLQGTSKQGTSKRRTQNPEKVRTNGCDVFKKKVIVLKLNTILTLKSHCAQIKYNTDIKKSLCSN